MSTHRTLDEPLLSVYSLFSKVARYIKETRNIWTTSDTESRRQSRWVELFDPERYYPVMEVLSSYLTIADFLVLCTVCKGLAGLKTRILSKVSNINVQLTSFLDDPIKFRYKLGECDTLISGSFALGTFELHHSKVLSLDIFIRNGTNIDRFTEYIRENENYEKDSQEFETSQTRWTYSSSTRPGIKLRVHRTDSPPIQAILTSAYTTACINLITWNKAYSIFPRQTLINHRFFPLRSLDDDFGSNLNELANQGWTTRDILWPDFIGAEVRKVEGLRRVGDRSTLVIPLDTDSVQAPSTPDFVIEHAQFDVSVNASQHNHYQSGFPQNRFQQRLFQDTHARTRFLHIQAQVMASPVTRHDYTTASPQWQSYVTNRLQRWAWLELYKLESETRPFQSTDSYPLISDISIPPEFDLPQSWDYADDQIPGWYQEWEQTQV